MKLLTLLCALAFFAWSIGRAVDYELAKASGPNLQLATTSPSGLWQGRSARWWAKRAVQARRDANKRGRTIRRLKAELRREFAPSSVRAIALASVAYRVSFSMLYRKAYCETGGTLSPFAKNPRSTASGLFQFLTSTWASTPYARFSIWDPYANSLAAAYMHRVGRGGEWSCR